MTITSTLPSQLHLMDSTNTTIYYAITTQLESPFTTLLYHHNCTELDTTIHNSNKNTTQRSLTSLSQLHSTTTTQLNSTPPSQLYSTITTRLHQHIYILYHHNLTPPTQLYTLPSQLDPNNTTISQLDSTIATLLNYHNSTHFNNPITA